MLPWTNYSLNSLKVDHECSKTDVEQVLSSMDGRIRTMEKSNESLQKENRELKEKAERLEAHSRVSSAFPKMWRREIRLITSQISSKSRSRIEISRVHLKWKLHTESGHSPSWEPEQ